MDYQSRGGSRPGAGAPASESQANVDRRERLRQLALETVDLSKDPYFMKNHLGSFECKLCLTLHNNEGNYLAHTQGKRHQSNLARRAAKEARDTPASSALLLAAQNKKAASLQARRTIKIGRPGYKITKSSDPVTGANSICFQIHFPEHAPGIQPRHRFMSSFEQKIEPSNKDVQYLLFACEPYETIGFKIPNDPVDKREGRFFSNWDKQRHTLTLQLYFRPASEMTDKMPAPPPPRPKLRYH